jgi:hypothetical protein
MPVAKGTVKDAYMKMRHGVCAEKISEEEKKEKSRAWQRSNLTLNGGHRRADHVAKFQGRHIAKHKELKKLDLHPCAGKSAEDLMETVEMIWELQDTPDPKDEDLKLAMYPGEGFIHGTGEPIPIWLHEIPVNWKEPVEDPKHDPSESDSDGKESMLASDHESDEDDPGCECLNCRFFRKHNFEKFRPQVQKQFDDPLFRELFGSSENETDPEIRERLNARSSKKSEKDELEENSTPPRVKEKKPSPSVEPKKEKKKLAPTALQGIALKLHEEKTVANTREIKCKARDNDRNPCPDDVLYPNAEFPVCTKHHRILNTMISAGVRDTSELKYPKTNEEFAAYLELKRTSPDATARSVVEQMQADLGNAGEPASKKRKTNPSVPSEPKDPEPGTTSEETDKKNDRACALQ